VNLAPIELFTYNHPWHTQQIVEALLKNAEAADSNLSIFLDGAKDESVQMAWLHYGLTGYRLTLRTKSVRRINDNG